MKSFLTPYYHGVWLEHDGDRMKFRTRVELELRERLGDPNGTLSVDETGPHWNGSKKCELSYSHTAGHAILVYSSTHQLGVDIELRNRVFHTLPLKLAERFVHADEVKELARQPFATMNSAFLNLWVKKEAYAKLTRRGIAQTVHESLILRTDFFFETIPVTPVTLIGGIAYRLEL